MHLSTWKLHFSTFILSENLTLFQMCARRRKRASSTLCAGIPSHSWVYLHLQSISIAPYCCLIGFAVIKASKLMFWFCSFVCVCLEGGVFCFHYPYSLPTHNSWPQRRTTLKPLPCFPEKFFKVFLYTLHPPFKISTLVLSVFKMQYAVILQKNQQFKISRFFRPFRPFTAFQSSFRSLLLCVATKRKVLKNLTKECQKEVESKGESSQWTEKTVSNRMGNKLFSACSNLGLFTLLDPPHIYTVKSSIVTYSSDIVVTTGFLQ